MCPQMAFYVLPLSYFPQGVIYAATPCRLADVIRGFFVTACLIVGALLDDSI